MKKTIDEMMRALGSSKPWVPRQLRTWHVSYDPGEGVQMSWYGGVHRCCNDRRPSKTHRSKLCRLQAVRICTETMVPIWQALLYGHHRHFPNITAELVEVTFESGGKFRIPTALVIESLRLLMRGEHADTRSTIYSKPSRRRLHRYRNSERRRQAKRNGRHTRWIEQATR